MRPASRHSDNVLPRERLDLLRQQLVLLVAVAQLAKASPAPAPDGAVGGEGEAMVSSSRHGDDALARQRLTCFGSSWPRWLPWPSLYGLGGADASDVHA